MQSMPKSKIPRQNPATSKTGNIIVPFRALPLPHELAVAKILVKTGHSVEFLPTSTHATPDIIFCHNRWEIKSPLSHNIRSIENNIRNALKQSPNIIIDLNRTSLHKNLVLTYLQNHIHNFRGLKKVLVVTKSQKVYEISPKSCCISELIMIK